MKAVGTAYVNIWSLPADYIFVPLLLKFILGIGHDGYFFQFLSYILAVAHIL